MVVKLLNKVYFLDTERKLNACKTFRRRPGGLLNVLCTSSLRPLSRGSLQVRVVLLRHLTPLPEKYKVDSHSYSCHLSNRKNNVANDPKKRT